MSEQHTQSLPAHIKMALDGWVAEFNDLKAFKETANATIEELRRQLAEADAVRRHAQEVSNELVKEKRELKIDRAMLRSILDMIKDELLARYDGAPDSTTRFMGEMIRDIEAAQAWVSISVVKDSLTTGTKEIATPSETIASVTAWANETFGKATIWRQIERARDEFDELTRLMDTHCSAEQIAEEAADVCICLYRVIGTLDPEAINKKMAKNRARKWNVNADGTAQHVGE